MFVLVFGEAIDNQPAFGLRSLIRRFTDLISVYEFNHRNALLSFLRMRNLLFVEKGRVVTVELASGEDLMAEFDDAGRLKSINGEAVS